ncbi:MAG: Gfo/Idh/MocA family oxidoreductase [Verrucomicrobiales bacterium]
MNDTPPPVPSPSSPSAPLDRRAFAKHSLAGLAAASTAGLAAPWSARSEEKPLRLALVSAATYGRPGQERTPGSNHGTAFSTLFNGWDEEKARSIEGTFVKSGRRIEGVRVVKIWDPNKAAARALAEACGIETVTDTPEECSEGVDAVILVDDGSGEQWKYAEHPLRQGIPTFCDKPLAMTARDAAAVASIVRETGTPFMSASSLRFVPDIVQLREELDEIGPVHLATTICGNDLIYYGIHALSMAYAVLGKGAVSAVNVGKPGTNVARIRFEPDLDVVLMTADRDRMRAGYQINLYGEKGWRTVTPDLKDLYAYLMEAFLDLVVTGKESVPVEEEVELIAALEAAEKSLELGREVDLSEVLAE